MIAQLRSAHRHGLIRSIDFAFAQFIRAHSDGCGDEVTLAAALASHAISQGHSCLDLSAAAERPSFAVGEEDDSGLDSHRNPALEPWLQALRECARVGGPHQREPLILDGHRLYLQRYWRYESELARRLLERAGALGSEDDVSTQAYFAPRNSGIDWQAIAAGVALDNRLTVIAGGPGTGKTYTVLRLLALLLEQHEPLQIRLAAPTGKAAVRVTESIRKDIAKLDCAETLRRQIPTEASTIHRLLGSQSGARQFRHNAHDPLPADVVVIDECSMVDLPLMAKLVQALKPTARLILIGDPNQLASVETGSVLAELCAAADGSRYSSAAAQRIERRTGYSPPQDERGGGFADAVVTLTESRRFTADSAIGRLARAVQPPSATAEKQPPAEDTLALFAECEELELASPTAEGLKQALRQGVRQGWYQVLSQAADPAQALAALQDFQILAALRSGPFGIENINRLVEHSLREEKLVQGRGLFYPGRPVMITQNDYRLGLFNGDIGICLPEQDGTLWVWFRKPDHSLQCVLPSQLGAHETAYAITIHKSQGSEYAHVLMVLPDRDSDFLTRELIYTGLSRAKERLSVWSPPQVLTAAIRKPLKRDSGLKMRLLE